MISIIDYNGGNVRSVQNALRRIGVDSVLTCYPKVVLEADKVILPGQGNMAQVRRALSDSGLLDVIPKLTRPFLGICVGMQLLYDRSEEGDTEGLGIISGTVRRFQSDRLTVPQMGWNSVQLKMKNAIQRLVEEKLKKGIMDGIADSEFFSFANSYFCPVTEESIATSDYAEKFCSVVQKDNFYGIQFHPEKSGEIGERLLRNFLNL